MRNMRKLSRVSIRRFTSGEEMDNIKSLFYSYRNITDINREQRQLHNMKLLTSDSEIKTGHLSTLSEAQKFQIDTLANAKLQELEDSGLSREELMDLPDKGIKLTADPFFQLVKSDIKARHKLLSRANVDYSIDNIVKFALTQDVGYDRAASGTGRRIKTDEDEFNQDRDGILADNHKYKHVEVEDYYRGASEPHADEYVQKEDIDILKPIKRVRKEKRTVINPMDIHWRNTELLVKFLTRFSTIKHRRYTGLSPVLHKKVAKTIKHSRNMNLLNHNSYMKPHYAKPLRTLAEDVEDDNFYEIDVETGTMHRENVYTPKEYDKEHFMVQMNYYNKEAIIKDQESKDVELLREAKEYLQQLKLRALNKNEHKGKLQPDMVASQLELKFKPVSEERLEQLKKSFDEFKAKYKDISFNDLAELIVAEVNEDVEAFEHFKEFSNVANIGTVNETYDELLDQLNLLKQSIGFNDEAYMENVVERNIVERLRNEEAE